MKKTIIIIFLLLTSIISADFNFGECSGSGTFEQQIHEFTNHEDTVDVGEIPKGIQGLKIYLISDKDVDIRLYGSNNDKIVHWPNGMLKKPSEETKSYKGVHVTYSGYNGMNDKKGHEFIKVIGTIPTTMRMKAFGYRAGYATVNYSWTGKEGCTPKKGGTGNFTQNLQQGSTSLVGTIPPNVKDVEINLSSDKDLDIQLYGVDGTAIVSWNPKGLLSGATKKSVDYHGMQITWSGYNGTAGKKGDEYIKISGVTSEMMVMKVYGYQAGSAAVSYKWGNLDTVPPVITLNGKSNITLYKGSIYKELGASAVDTIDGNVSVTIEGKVNTSKVGDYIITYRAKDSAGNSSQKVRTITVKAPVKILQSISISPNPINLRVGQNVQVNVTGFYSNGSSSTVDDVEYTITDTNIASVDTTGSIDGLIEGNTIFRASVGNIISSAVNVTVAKELNVTNFNAINFGSTYIDQIPNDATVDSYDEKRFCMIAGQILSEDDTPLQGVKVSIHKHPEYGSTITDSNGSYAIPAEGGLQLRMRYSKEGYTTIDRNIQAPVQDWVRTPDVTMLAVDTKVTNIDLTNTSPNIHISTPVTDDRGERSTTLVFDGVTKATVTALDGSTRELTNINVRATEFKVPKSMPSDLPSTSAFTYCSDLKIDGVTDDEEVSFDAPVVMYVENFLGFEVGEIVPVGYYDRKSGEWKASDNGVVVKLLDTDGDGKIDALDSNGSDTPNDLNGNGIFTDEVTGIANNPKYAAGKSYWRAEVTHFTPWDHNWPYGPPADSKDPDKPDPKTDDDPKNDCQVDISSYVTKKSRVFHEDIPVAGTDITLHYSSKRVDGYKYIIDASIDMYSAPASVVGATITLDIAGRTFVKTPTLGELNNLNFEWDGKDALGKSVSGDIGVTIRVVYRYNMVYYRASSDFSRAWARTSSASTGIIGRDKIDMISSKRVKLHVGEAQSSNMGRGWTLSSYDIVLGNTIVRGDGTIVKPDKDAFIGTIAGGRFFFGYSGDGGFATEALLSFPEDVTIDSVGNLYIADSYNKRVRKVDSSGIITTIAGNGSLDYTGDGGLATEASFRLIKGIVIDSAGNLYIADSSSNTIRKVDSAGIITTIAGHDGSSGYSGDGGLATEAVLNSPTGVSVDSLGNLYIADTNNHCIRKVDTAGIITTIAGHDGSSGYSGDGGLAREAVLNSPIGVSVDSLGNLYIADRNNHCIRKVDTAGIITTIAGHDGSSGYSGDGGLAREAVLDSPQGVSVDSLGNLYIADTNNHCIRKVDSAGIITTIAGNGSSGYSGDGGLAINASLFSPRGISVDGTGNLYISDYNNGSIRKVSFTTLFQTYNQVSNQHLYKNSNNTADIFYATGKHLKTIDLQTGKALKTFGYDENNHLIIITDQFNQTTTITRDANGNPTQITAPNGQITTLTVDENGDLIEVRYEDNSKYEFSYYDGSLMNVMKDPNGNEIKHNFNGIGRIVEEIDGMGGSYRFLRNIIGGETFYSTVLPQGETSSSKDVKLANGNIKSIMTTPTGETSTATFAKDDSNATILRDGVRTDYTYTTDSLTHQRTLASKEVTQPSGLKNSTTYTTSYDGNATHTNTKTQTITQNTKATTDVTDYINGKETLTSPTGRTVLREYDVDTLLTSSTTTGTFTPTTFSYDAKGRTTKETTGDREISYSYDAKGNVATITDPRGQATSYAYDIMDRLTTVTYPNGKTEHFSYDANGNLLKRTVPTPADHSFTYNGADLRSNYTSPLNKATTYSYDRSKNLTQITKPSGKTIVNSYTNGRLASTVAPEGTTNYSYLYTNKVGSISKGSESFSFTYDGTLLTKTVQAGVLNHTTDYSYNNDFQVTSATYAGVTENYSYDNDGLLITSGAYTLTRDTQNAYITSLTDGTLTQNRTYNGYGEVTEISDNTFTYQLTNRDNAGAITQKKETINGTTITYDYSYNSMGRLIEVKKDNSVVEAYTYDDNGNRDSAIINGTSTTASYTLDDALNVYGDNTYRYDEDGYLKEKVTPSGTTIYSYGTMGELKAVNTPTKNITYQHNALNQRVAKLVNGQVVEKYLWENLTTLLAIYDKDDNLKQRFAYADQRMPVSMTSNGTQYYLHYDQVGSLRAITDAEHAIVKEITYDTYGNILTDSNEAFKVPFGFAGGLYDTDTKLTRFGYRDYDAYTGKWTAKDPIEFAGGDSNLYGYVLGDPVGFLDTKGLAEEITPVEPIDNYEDSGGFDKPWPDAPHTRPYDSSSTVINKHKRWRKCLGKYCDIMRKWDERGKDTMDQDEWSATCDYSSL